MVVCTAAPDARQFTLRATKGKVSNSICPVPFLLQTFDTVEFVITVTINDDGTWLYEEDSVLKIAGQDELFTTPTKTTSPRLQNRNPIRWHVHNTAPTSSLSATNCFFVLFTAHNRMRSSMKLTAST